jgi:hypothetical protein
MSAARLLAQHGRKLVGVHVSLALGGQGANLLLSLRFRTWTFLAHFAAPSGGDAVHLALDVEGDELAG